MALIILSCAWVLGLYVGTNVAVPIYLAVVSGIPLAIIAVARTHRQQLVLAGLAIIALVSGAAYAYASLHSADSTSLRFYRATSGEIRGMVAGDPEITERSRSVKLSGIEIRGGDGWQPAKGGALVILPRYPEYKYGDRLTLSGKVEDPSDAGYGSRLADQGLDAVIRFPRVQSAESGHGSVLLSGIYALRERLSDIVKQVLPEPQASLVDGILLGKRGMIPADLMRDFSRSGTAHILAISGANLTIFAGILVAAGICVFGRRHYIYVWLALAAVWLYTVLTGMSPPVVRAAIMSSLFLVAERLGRQRSGITALCFAAAVMAGISPYILSSASFQMSFLSMAGLILLHPRLSDLVTRLLELTVSEGGALFRLGRLVGDSLATSLSALLGIWPLIAHYFGIVSPAGPVATLLAFPVLPGIILSGIAAGVAGLVFLPVAQVIGWIAWIFASYLIALVTVSVKVPAAFFQVEPIPNGFVVAYYLALAAVLLLIRYRTGVGAVLTRLKPALASVSPWLRPKIVIPPLMILAALSTVAAASMPDTRLHVYFLDVGQGDAILVQKGSQQVLIDGGMEPGRLMRGLSGRMPFWDRDIELVVLTHPHNDHLGGQVEVLDRYHVGRILAPDTPYSSAVFAEWTRLVGDKGIPRTTPRAGQRINLGGGAAISVLNPAPRPLTGTDSDIDNNSTVLRLSMGEVSFLFTGDMMVPAERELIAQRPGLSSTVLKVAHHGSSSSTSPEFLASVNPRVAVISTGTGNTFGHPNTEVTARLTDRLGAANLYRTDRTGTVEFITDGQRLWVRGER